MQKDVQNELRKAADTYIRATYEGDAGALAELFHKAAIMSGYLDGQLIQGGPGTFIEQIATMPSLESSGAAYSATVEYLHAGEGVGSVTIAEKGFGPLDFINYLHFLNEDGKWQIISKTFVGKPGSG